MSPFFTVILLIGIIVIGIIINYLIIREAVASAVHEVLMRLDPGDRYWKAIVRNAINEASGDSLKTIIKEAIAEAAHEAERGQEPK